MLLKSETFSRLCEARELLQEVDGQRLSIEDVARRASMSPYHFIRQFSAVFGVTPHQFRIRRRLDEAKLLLAKGELSVTEVCLEVGFESLGSFSDLFTRRVGIPPSRYRRSVRPAVRVSGMPPLQFFPGCLTLMGALPSSAFRNFREAPVPTVRLESGLSGEDIHANQANQYHGR